MKTILILQTSFVTCLNAIREFIDTFAFDDDAIARNCLLAWVKDNSIKFLSITALLMMSYIGYQLISIAGYGQPLEVRDSIATAAATINYEQVGMPLLMMLTGLFMLLFMSGAIKNIGFARIKAGAKKLWNFYWHGEPLNMDTHVNDFVSESINGAKDWLITKKIEARTQAKEDREQLLTTLTKQLIETKLKKKDISYQILTEEKNLAVDIAAIKKLEEEKLLNAARPYCFNLEEAMEVVSHFITGGNIPTMENLPGAIKEFRFAQL